MARSTAAKRRASSAPPRPASALERLHAIRHRYSPAETAEKLALLAQLERQPPRARPALAAYHDDLLFLRAFPDNLRVQTLAIRALGHTARRVHALPARQRRALDDSGVAGTTTKHAFAFGIARWLVNVGEAADIAWDDVETPERLDPLLRLTLTQAEADAFDSGELSTRGWLDLARGSARAGALAWLARDAQTAAGPAGTRSALAVHDAARRPAEAPDPAVVRLMYEALELPVRWRVSPARSVSGNAVAGATPIFRTSMRGAPADPVAHIAAPLPGIVRLAGAEGERWLDASRAALASRCREVHAITYANPDEIWRADLGEGAHLCLIGAAPDDRLTLEANYGYVLFSNGVPVGYGGVTPLAAQANTGVNIFDAFRHAEAAMLFAQALRAFRTLFGVTRFIVNPYQFGAGNDEALASGAFWFYDRLGFHPVDARVAALAAQERARRAANREHRTSIATLRRLAAGDLVLELPGAVETSLFEERWLVTLARAVTRTLATPEAAARLARRDATLDAVARAIGLRQWRSRDAETRFGLQRVGPIVALVLDQVKQWSPHDRRALVALFKAKGNAQERDFALRSRQHTALWRALSDFCRAEEMAGKR
ncbi:MAG: hypothetical protein IT359_19075 [Gemmatimonadaceae bacterium]|nr:hypothetical protein [Gemmatimonadaceae bacterium]